MKNKLMIVIPILVWLIIGIYGIGYNITYIDEAKYLIKGWLMTTGQVGYYSTPEFFYQHMPGGLLWYGLGQRIFGPSLLAARIQSFLIGLLVMLVAYKLAGLINPKTKKNILPILSLGTVAILYYSSAVPQSLAALSLVLAFYWLFKNNFFLTTTWFTLAFIVRENFLFTLIIYFIYLLIYQRKIWLAQAALAAGIISLFFLPGWPGIVNVLKNFPGVSLLLPISLAEKSVLEPNWIKENYNLSKYFQAVKEFGEVYFGFLLAGLISLIYGLKHKTLWLKDKRWQLLIVIAGVNFLAHTWSAYQLSPRAIIPYFAYFYPLIAVIIARLLPNKILKFYALFLILAIAGLLLASLFQKPSQGNTIKRLNLSANDLKAMVESKEKIVWLAGPMSLYLAGKVSYYPLINQTNFYKISADTATVRALGFFNKVMLEDWLKTADLVVIDKNRLSGLKANPKTAEVTILIEEKLLSEYKLMPPPETFLGENLGFYEPLIK